MDNVYHVSKRIVTNFIGWSCVGLLLSFGHHLQSSHSTLLLRNSLRALLHSYRSVSWPIPILCEASGPFGTFQHESWFKPVQTFQDWHLCFALNSSIIFTPWWFLTVRWWKHVNLWGLHFLCVADSDELLRLPCLPCLLFTLLRYDLANIAKNGGNNSILFYQAGQAGSGQVAVACDDLVRQVAQATLNEIVLLLTILCARLRDGQKEVYTFTYFIYFYIHLYIFVLLYIFIYFSICDSVVFASLLYRFDLFCIRCPNMSKSHSASSFEVTSLAMAIWHDILEVKSAPRPIQGHKGHGLYKDSPP